VGQYDYTPQMGQYGLPQLMQQPEDDPMLTGDPRLQRSRMLPRAVQSAGGTLTNAVKPGQSLQQQADNLMKMGMDEYNREPDVAGLQAYAKQRAGEGDAGMLNAIAAQFAGPGFAPVEAHYLKRAAAAGEPLKAGNAGYITPDGQFVRDPTYQSDKKAETYLRMATQYSNQAQDERASNDRLQMMEMMRAAQGAGPLGTGEASALGVDQAGNTVYRSVKSGQLFKYGPDGQPTLHTGPVLAKTSSGAATEDQSKAAGWFMQAENARRNMESAIKQDPQAAFMTVPESLKGHVPFYGEDLANSGRTAPRQKFVNAASSMSEAFLRAATGAGVNKDEALQKVREIVPQLGDKPETVRQKTASYGVYMAALKARAGRGLANVDMSVLPPDVGAGETGDTGGIIDLPPRRP
jgi:hypothetical protein